MTARVVDLPRVAAALRSLDVLVSEHPALVSEDARERCAEWLAGEPPDHAEEPDQRAAGDLPGDEPDSAEGRAEGSTAAARAAHEAEHRGEVLARGTDPPVDRVHRHALVIGDLRNAPPVGLEGPPRAPPFGGRRGLQCVQDVPRFGLFFVARRAQGFGSDGEREAERHFAARAPETPVHAPLVQEDPAEPPAERDVGRILRRRVRGSEPSNEAEGRADGSTAAARKPPHEA